jgi:hypothetical protein
MPVCVANLITTLFENHNQLLEEISIFRTFIRSQRKITRGKFLQTVWQCTALLGISHSLNHSVRYLSFYRHESAPEAHSCEPACQRTPTNSSPHGSPRCVCWIEIFLNVIVLLLTEPLADGEPAEPSRIVNNRMLLPQHSYDASDHEKNRGAFSTGFIGGLERVHPHGSRLRTRHVWSDWTRGSHSSLHSDPCPFCFRCHPGFWRSEEMAILTSDVHSSLSPRLVVQQHHPGLRVRGGLGQAPVHHQVC